MLIGTVFQTAVPLFLVILRLRPRLLSLRSVLASSQIYQQTTKQQDNKAGWKPVPSVARVTRDAVSGLLKEIEVMLSGRQYPIDVLARLWLARHVQRQSRIKPMRRICSFTDFFCVVGFICACRALGLPRIISCWRPPAPYRRKCNP